MDAPALSAAGAFPERTLAGLGPSRRFIQRGAQAGKAPPSGPWLGPGDMAPSQGDRIREMPGRMHLLSSAW